MTNSPGTVRKGFEPNGEQCWFVWSAHASDAVQFGHPDSKVAEDILKEQEDQLEMWNSISTSGDIRDWDSEP